MFGFDRKPQPDRPDGATAESDRRGAERVGAEQLPHVSAQLSAAGDIRLIDISKTGARFESHRRLPPNSSVALRLATPESTLVVSGRVVRSRIVRLPDGALGCEVGVAFTKPLTGLLEEGATTTATVTVEETTSTTDGLANAFQQLGQATDGHPTALPLQSERNQLASQLDVAQEALRAWTELEASLQADMRRVTETLASERVAWDQAREELESRLAGASSALEVSETAIASIRKELTMTDAARRAAEQAHIDDRREFDDAIRTMQAEIARAGDEQRAAQSDTSAWLEVELARVRTELQAAQADRDVAARHRLVMEEQLRDAWSRADSFRAEADSLRARLDEAQAQTQSLEVAVDTPVAREDQSRQSLLLEEVGKLAMAMAPQIEGALGSDSARALALIRQLSRFAQKRSTTLADVALNDAVRRAEPILRQLVGIDIDFTIALGEARVIGSADIDQLITSLVVSGRDLLPMGGSLVVKTGAGLAIHVSGYGVQTAQPVPALALVAERCGGELRLSSEPGQYSVLEVLFARVNPV